VQPIPLSNGVPLYLQEAYELAEEFCRKLGSRMKGSGFLRTLLMRRVGSSIVAGRITAEKMLGSVEDRVHQLLSSRLQGIFTPFGKVPDVLEDVWIDVALGAVERAKQIIAAVPNRHPFDIKYEQIEKIDWGTCEQVLSAQAKRAALTRGW